MTPTRPIVTGICLAAFGAALFASTIVDRGQEASGRSPLAREAERFAAALEGRSMSDALAFLTPQDRRDPRVQLELRESMSRLAADLELMVSHVALEPGGEKGQSKIQVLRPTPRGPQPVDVLTFTWVRTAQGTWKAEWD